MPREIRPSSRSGVSDLRGQSQGWSRGQVSFSKGKAAGQSGYGASGSEYFPDMLCAVIDEPELFLEFRESQIPPADIDL